MPFLVDKVKLLLQAIWPYIRYFYLSIFQTPSILLFFSISHRFVYSDASFTSLIIHFKPIKFLPSYSLFKYGSEFFQGIQQPHFQNLIFCSISNLTYDWQLFSPNTSSFFMLCTFPTKRWAFFWELNRLKIDILRGDRDMELFQTPLLSFELDKANILGIDFEFLCINIYNCYIKFYYLLSIQDQCKQQFIIIQRNLEAIDRNYESYNYIHQQYCQCYNIYNRMNQQSSDEDSWQPNCKKQAGASQINDGRNSMFNKIVIKFTNQDINNNIQEMLSKPAYYNDDEEQEDQELDKEELKEKKKKQQQKHQALYDPLQDDENQQWVHKNCGNTVNRPLTCPNCFSQLAYSYKAIPGSTLMLVQRPQNIQVHQTKIIRNKDCCLELDKLGFSKISEQQKAKILGQREEEINVKIVCTCICGVDIGYYDVNKGKYVLANVV